MGVKHNRNMQTFTHTLEVSLWLCLCVCVFREMQCSQTSHICLNIHLTHLNFMTHIRFNPLLKDCVLLPLLIPSKALTHTHVLHLWLQKACLMAYHTPVALISTQPPPHHNTLPSLICVPFKGPLCVSVKVFYKSIISKQWKWVTRIVVSLHLSYIFW